MTHFLVFSSEFLKLQFYLTYSILSLSTLMIILLIFSVLKFNFIFSFI